MSTRNDRLTTLALILLLGGCAGDKDLLTDVLDESSGASHVQPREPLRLSRVRPGLTATGGDFVFVAPMLVNRRGSSRHFFWVATATTVDRRLAGLAPVDVSQIVLVLDGEPMALTLTPWSDVSPIAPFDVGMFRLGEFAARATPSQIERVAAATTLGVVLIDADGRAQQFDRGTVDRRPWLALSSDRPRSSQRIAHSD